MAGSPTRCSTTSSPIRGHPNPETEAAILRRVGVAESTGRAVGVEVPAAAADDALLARCGTARIDVGAGALDVRAVPVGGPFPDVPVHVREAPAVRRKRTGRRRLLAEPAGRKRPVGNAAVV